MISLLKKDLLTLQAEWAWGGVRVVTENNVDAVTVWPGMCSCYYCSQFVSPPPPAVADHPDRQPTQLPDSNNNKTSSESSKDEGGQCRKNKKRKRQ